MQTAQLWYSSIKETAQLFAEEKLGSEVALQQVGSGRLQLHSSGLLWSALIWSGLV